MVYRISNINSLLEQSYVWNTWISSIILLNYIEFFSHCSIRYILHIMIRYMTRKKRLGAKHSNPCKIKLKILITDKLRFKPKLNFKSVLLNICKMMQLHWERKMLSSIIISGYKENSIISIFFHFTECFNSTSKEMINKFLYLIKLLLYFFTVLISGNRYTNFQMYG